MISLENWDEALFYPILAPLAILGCWEPDHPLPKVDAVPPEERRVGPAWSDGVVQKVGNCPLRVDSFLEDPQGGLVHRLHLLVPPPADYFLLLHRPPQGDELEYGP